MSEEWVKIIAPATISNLGPGFDVFGMALQKPFDTILVRKIDQGVVISSVEGEGADSIPRECDMNSAGIAAKEVLGRCGVDFGIEMKVIKGIRPCSGIGSSGASAAGGAFAAHILCEEALSTMELVMCAAHAEEVTSGGLHADNVAPCLMGGFTVIRSYQPFEAISIRPARNLGVVVAMPDILVPTMESRKVLPHEVKVSDLVFHVGNASCLVHGMQTGDLDLLGRSVRDAVFEPARAYLIPHLKQAEDIAMSLGAKASFLGGSGPCIISFIDMENMDGQNIADAIRDMYHENGIGCESWVTSWGEGCRRS
ncbi:MAG: homoserine kinase [Candidatus Methanomethylophilaceae archaeon]